MAAARPLARAAGPRLVVLLLATAGVLCFLVAVDDGALAGAAARTWRVVRQRATTDLSGVGADVVGGARGGYGAERGWALGASDGFWEAYK
jgi:hypothetical protein